MAETLYLSHLYSVAKFELPFVMTKMRSDGTGALSTTYFAKPVFINTQLLIRRIELSQASY